MSIIEDALFGDVGISRFFSALQRWDVKNGEACTIYVPPSCKNDLHIPSDIKSCLQLSKHLGFNSEKELLEETSLRDGLLILATVNCNDSYIIDCSIQIMVTNKVVTTEDEQKKMSLAISNYYRMDFNSDERGCMLSHPYPHIHTQIDGAPRFPVMTNHAESPLISFIEFVIINHFPEDWVAWAMLSQDEELLQLIHKENIEGLDSIDVLFDLWKDKSKWDQLKHGEIISDTIVSTLVKRKKQLSTELPKFKIEKSFPNYHQQVILSDHKKSEHPSIGYSQNRNPRLGSATP